ncbi:MAG: nucleotidyltransferase domain-containing protein [Oscillospiraceae bacterium]|jgi:predicted nucleotidyltransferase|nr:nucleotidyltransferase domain-containing protein [Oscillospiraceae bacterium]
MCDQSTLKQITNKVVQVINDYFGNNLDKIILYGSYARGDNDGDSDIDIMALVDVSPEDANRIDMQLTTFTSRLGLEYDVVISLFIKDCDTFYKHLHIEPFYQNVMKEGVILGA